MGFAFFMSFVGVSSTDKCVSSTRVAVLSKVVCLLSIVSSLQSPELIEDNMLALHIACVLTCSTALAISLPPFGVDVKGGGDGESSCTHMVMADRSLKRPPWDLYPFEVFVKVVGFERFFNCRRR